MLCLSRHYELRCRPLGRRRPQGPGDARLGQVDKSREPFWPCPPLALREREISLNGVAVAVVGLRWLSARFRSVWQFAAACGGRACFAPEHSPSNLPARRNRQFRAATMAPWETGHASANEKGGTTARKDKETFA